MTRFGKALAMLLATVSLLASTGLQAEISASIDRNRVALGDTLRLTLSADDGEDIAAIDLTPLQRDFEILGRSSSTKTSIINGRYSSSKELLLDITPRRQGNLAIPALRLGAQSTDSLQLVVGPPPTGAGGNEAVSFEAEVDSDSVYVQGQLVLTLRVQEAINLDDRSISELKLDSAFIHTLEQQSFQRNINGRPHLVHEVRYAIFPEQSGTLTIPVLTYSARERGPRRSLFDLGGGGRQLRRQTQALQIEVLPRPASYPNADWLPATEVTIEESWSTPPEQLQVGESATRTVTLRGVGLQGAQLPPILYPATQGLKFYPDQPVINDSEAASGLIGTRVDSVAIVPTSAGNWEIPALRIPWWDTRSDTLRYAELPARQLAVSPADPAALPPTPLPQAAPAAGSAGVSPAPAIHVGQTPTGNTRLWQLVSAACAIGWLLTLIYHFRSRPRRAAMQTAGQPENSDETRAFKAALGACDSGDPARARQAIIAWASLLAQQARPLSLAQLASAFAHPQLETALAELDRVLYSGATASWDGRALAAALRDARAQRGDNSKPAGSEFQLYPQGA